MIPAVDQLRATIADQPPTGTLRIFGDWFGRPFDNVHRVVSADVRDDLLVIAMDDGEVLTVTNPSDIEIGAGAFRIGRADRVRLEWFAYGQPRESADRYEQEHWVDGDRVRAVSSAELYGPSFSPSLEHPAVELVSLADLR
jgi:hypothetical protein